jgi:hypothetical protein
MQKELFHHRVRARRNENKSALFRSRSQRVADAAKIKIDDEAIKIRGAQKRSTRMIICVSPAWWCICLKLRV